MVGLIQKVLLDLIHEKAGPEAVDEVKRRANVPDDRVFRIGEVYSDDEWQRLFAVSLDVLDLSQDQAYEAYAQAFCADARQRFPKWFDMAKNSRMFLEYQTTIHNTFASGVVDASQRQAVNDKFLIDKIDERHIVTHYRSPNKLCGLYKALARCMAGHYGDEILIDERQCLDRGDRECEIHVTWKRFKGE
jgi:hypothetical protein